MIEPPHRPASAATRAGALVIARVTAIYTTEMPSKQSLELSPRIEALTASAQGSTTDDLGAGPTYAAIGAQNERHSMELYATVAVAAAANRAVTDALRTITVTATQPTATITSATIRGQS